MSQTSAKKLSVIINNTILQNFPIYYNYGMDKDKGISTK